MTFSPSWENLTFSYVQDDERSAYEIIYQWRTECPIDLPTYFVCANQSSVNIRHGKYEKCLCARILTPIGNQLPHLVSKINPCVRQRLSWGRTIAALGYRRGRQNVTMNAPMAVRIATIFNSSPGFPAGFTKDVEISVDTPVMYWQIGRASCRERV